jgi:hypothetical protein
MFEVLSPLSIVMATVVVADDLNLIKRNQMLEIQ